MKKLELILAILIVVSALAKFFLIQISDYGILFGCTLLAMIYFYLGFALFNNIGFRKIFKKDSYVNINAGRIIGAIGSGVALSIVIIGIQFKLLTLAGSIEMLLIGTTSLAVIMLIAGGIYLFKYKGKSDFYRGIFIRAIPVFVIGLVLCYMPVASQH